MKLLIYIEPTSYLMPLCHEIRARTSDAAHIVFLDENLTQSWDFDLSDDPGIKVLRGSRWVKLKALQQLLNQWNVEVVHLAGWGHPLLLAALILARLQRIPVTMETDTQLPVGLPIWKRAVKRLIYPILFKFPAMFLPGGTRQAIYLNYYGVSPERIKVAQMTVDVANISAYTDNMEDYRRSQVRVMLGLPVDAVVFLYVGRLEPYKGIQELLSAFALLSAASDPVALLLVGDGSMKESVIKAARVDTRICYTGRLSGNALLDAYTASDVFVLPSRFEPWGLVVNEAMACGLPVIATDSVGCVDDLVIEGETGLVVPAESVQALTDAMAALLLAPLLRDKMSRNSRSLIDGWTIQKEVEILVTTWKLMQEY